MAVDASADRRELHALIEHIRTDDIPSVKQFLRSKVDAFELLLMNGKRMKSCWRSRAWPATTLAT